MPDRSGRLVPVLHVAVTAWHILHGVPGTWGQCPIALAIKMLDPADIMVVHVTPHTITWSRVSTDLRYEIATPRGVRSWLRRLDDWALGNGSRPRPFAFDMDEAAARTWPRSHRISVAVSGLRTPGSGSMSWRPAPSELAAIAREQAS